MKLHFAVMLHFVADRSGGGLLATVHIIRVFQNGTGRPVITMFHYCRRVSCRLKRLRERDVAAYHKGGLFHTSLKRADKRKQNK